MTDIDELIRGALVRTVLQPIVDLDTGAVVAYEALSRGPAGVLERPDVMFAAARDAGRLTELDELCRDASLRNAISVGLRDPLTLFVNVEPEVLEIESLDALVRLAQNAPGGMQVVLEITERAIASRPAELLAGVRELRAAGWRIALDDVGADDLSLAFMPLLRPDVVKLDMRLVQARPGPDIARIVNAVNAYAERTGAVLLAEGIENDEHRAHAQALGARLGQGWHFGRPAPALQHERPVAALQFGDVVPLVTQTSPFACLPAGAVLRVSPKALLIELSKHLERAAMPHGTAALVLSTFQHAHHFTPATVRRYERLAGTVGFVAAVGVGLPESPASGVRGASLATDDVVRDEWDIVVLSPHFSAALLARDLGDDGPDYQRRFEFALTYDRASVSAAAETLMSRVLPRAGRAPAHVELPRVPESVGAA